jgi:ubiquinone/menaquinone biosynthesis C-methylase UbiE
MNTRMTISYFNRLNSVSKNVKKGKNLLNIACGFGDYNYYLRNNFKESYGIDISLPDVVLASELNKNDRNMHFMRGDIKKIPFKNGFFDSVICIETLEHINKPEKALSELARVVSKEGLVIITIPVREFPFTYDPINTIRQKFGKKPIPFGAYGFGHESLYFIKDVKAMVRAHFEIVEEKYLSHSLIGLIENYIPSIFSKVIKTNYNNKSNKKVGSVEKKNRTDYQFPAFLKVFYKFIIFTDNILFRWDKRCAYHI